MQSERTSWLTRLWEPRHSAVSSITILAVVAGLMAVRPAGARSGGEDSPAAGRRGSSGTPASARANADSPAGASSVAAKRDPFKLPPPPLPQSELDLRARPTNLPPGPRGLLIDDLKLEGVVSEDHGMIAVVTTSARNRAYFLTQNEEVYDGRVTRITGNAIYFEQRVRDRSGRVTVRQTVKPITPGEVR